MRAAGALLILLAMSASAGAQESRFHAELRVEAEHVKEDCGQFALKRIPGCVVSLVTEHPLHITLGSIAPQNGFAFGAAVVTHYSPTENWALGWNSDAVVAPGGAWRAGSYFRSVRTAVALPQVVPAGSRPPAPIRIHEYPVFSAYAQAISLPKLTYFGLGPDSPREARTTYGMTQGILGSNAVVPVTAAPLSALALSLLGEINVRLVDLRAGTSAPSSIDSRFSETTAPGLSTQPAFVQLGEGLRFKPSLLNGHAVLNYLVQLQQFGAPSDSTYAFRRWTLDFDHEIPLYRTSMPGRSLTTNGPNECATGPDADKCAPISRDRWGTVTFRLLASKSIVSSGSVVPFYFQQTLGGSDINGIRSLASYEDYRFRGPHVLLLQESVEHAVYGPIGLFVSADQGKVALQNQKLDFTDLRRSYAVGLTVRAGGFPAVVASYATGGPEGHHIAFTINTSLLGGSSRPSLF